MAGHDPVLELAGVARTYDDGVPVYALRATDLVIYDGDYLSISGPSGAGKSTLLNLLGLLDQPSEGRYLVRGIDSAIAPERVRAGLRNRVFGFVFQGFHLLPGRSARENVELGMLYGRSSAKARKRRAAEALERVGLEQRAHADPRTLSGGERQRVAIARAVATQPSVLLCDEPTGNLDSRNTENVIALLDQLHADGLTIVVVSHQSDVAERARRRIAVVDGIAEECPDGQGETR